MSARRPSRAVVLIALFSALVAAPGAAAATGPFEPNDSPLDAAGPLSLDHAYQASLEAAGDSDYYLFYVGAAQGAEARVTLEDLGGGPPTSDIDVTILDSAMTPLGAASYIRAGEARTVAVQLRPQRYLVQVAPGEGFGDTYSLRTAGTRGAFVPYEAIASRCSAATDDLVSAKTALRKARARQQRLLGRLRRARYWGRAARRAAHAAFRRSEARIAASQAALKRAGESRAPWCFIAL